MIDFQFIIIICLIECCYTQYTANIKPKVLSCENSSHAEMINHFFSSVFTDFQSPPVCMCVQMCTGKPTYCHPSNCIKNFEEKKITKPAVEVDPSPYFSNGEKQHDYMKEYIESHQRVEPMKGEYSENTNLIPDIFGDRYNSLFNYRKTPRIDLKYLKDPIKKLERLQIERADISKTRWPTNKYSKLFVKPLLLDSQYNKQVLEKQTLLTAVIPEYSQLLYDTTKTFKRDLSKTSNFTFDSQGNVSFSLDHILHNLVGDSSEVLKNNSHGIYNETEVIVAQTVINNTNNIATNENEEKIINITKSEKEGKYNKEIAMVDNIGNLINDILTSISKDNDEDNTAETTESNDDGVVEISSEKTMILSVTSTEKVVQNINGTNILNN